jgi:hypothetical protein
MKAIVSSFNYLVMFLPESRNDNIDELIIIIIIIIIIMPV